MTNIPVTSITQTPLTTGGLSTVSNILANNTTSVAIKASPGQLFHFEGWNISAATPVWIKLYDATQAGTTAGSGTPKWRIMIPSAGVTGAGVVSMDMNGIPFGTAITYVAVTGIADNDTTAPAAATYAVNFGYK